MLDCGRNWETSFLKIGHIRKDAPDLDSSIKIEIGKFLEGFQQLRFLLVPTSPLAFSARLGNRFCKVDHIRKGSPELDPIIKDLAQG